MTVSSITTVRFSLNEIVREAFDIIGVGSEGEAITADMYRRGKMSAQLMTQTWNAIENLWRKQRVDLALVADQASYPLAAPKPMRVMSARRKQTAGGYETPMTMWSRQEYLDMPNKATSNSVPVNFYYDPQAEVGNLYLWPAPASGPAAQYSVILDVLRPMFIMNDSADTLDMPAEWQEAFVMGLAKRLKLKYPVGDSATDQRIDQMAENLFGAMKAWDNEPASIYLQPDDYFAWR